MAQGFTSQMARNIFYGGTAFFVLLFAALIFDTEQRIPERSKSAEITPAVVRGKHIWETRNCIGCHWIKAQPTGAPGRRQMPNFHFTDAQLDDMVEFLKWTNGVNTENWPPNIEG